MEINSIGVLVLLLHSRKFKAKGKRKVNAELKRTVFQVIDGIRRT